MNASSTNLTEQTITDGVNTAVIEVTPEGFLDGLKKQRELAVLRAEIAEAKTRVKAAEYNGLIVDHQRAHFEKELQGCTVMHGEPEPKKPSKKKSNAND